RTLTELAKLLCEFFARIVRIIGELFPEVICGLRSHACDNLFRISAAHSCEETLDSGFGRRESHNGPLLPRDTPFDFSQAAGGKLARLEFFSNPMVGGTQLVQLCLLRAELPDFVSETQQLAMCFRIGGWLPCVTKRCKAPVLICQPFRLDFRFLRRLVLD